MSKGSGVVALISQQRPVSNLLFYVAFVWTHKININENKNYQNNDLNFKKPSQALDYKNFYWFFCLFFLPVENN